MADIKLTPADLKTIKKLASLTIGSVFVFCIIACFVFSKVTTPTVFEYRPIVVSAPTRALNTAYQPSTSRFVSVSCSVNITSTLSLTGGQSGTVTLQTSPDGTTYTTMATATNNNTGSLTIGLNTSQAQAGDLVATVPPGYFYKIVSSGTSTFSLLQVQETNL